jgi:hypothetical protein
MSQLIYFEREIDSGKLDHILRKINWKEIWIRIVSNEIYSVVRLVRTGHVVPSSNFDP